MVSFICFHKINSFFGRFKQIIEDRDAQITQLKIEGDVARSQASNLRKEVEDVRLKLADYEKMSKFQKVVSSESDESNQLKEEIDHLKKQLSVEKKDKKSEINLMKMRYDSKVCGMLATRLSFSHSFLTCRLPCYPRR